MNAFHLAVFRVYQQSFQTHPHVTLAVTGGSLNAIGDIVAQTAQNILERKQHGKSWKYDAARTARFFCFGVMISPLLGRWNGFLERRFPLRSLTSNSNKVSVRALAKRVAADQLFMAPIGLAAFIGGMGLMEGRSTEQIQQKYKDMYKPAIITNWQVWPIAQLINFRYMPLPYRVPFQSSCGVFWTLYLSIINSKESTKAKADAEFKELVK